MCHPNLTKDFLQQEVNNSSAARAPSVQTKDKLCVRCCVRNKRGFAEDVAKHKRYNMLHLSFLVSCTIRGFDLLHTERIASVESSSYGFYPQPTARRIDRCQSNDSWFVLHFFFFFPKPI